MLKIGSWWEAAVYHREHSLVLSAEQRGESETTGGRAKREKIDVYLRLIDDIIQQKLAQHCKTIIFIYIYTHTHAYVSKGIKAKQTGRPVVENPSDTAGDKGFIPGPGILHILWGD